MPTVFPGGVDTFPSAATLAAHTLGSDPHSKLHGDLGDAVVALEKLLVGFVAPYAGSSVPTGWLACDGSAVSRTTYAALFAAVGTNWGAGDGSTTFNVPDLRDRTPIGTSPGSLAGNRPTARTLGQTGGEETHVLATGELAAHSHGLSTLTTNGVLSDSGGPVTRGDGTAGDGGSVTPPNQNTDGTGSNTAHNNMQPFAVVQWLIKT